MGELPVPPCALMIEMTEIRTSRTQLEQLAV
jgi:hypothetical protein